MRLRGFLLSVDGAGKKKKVEYAAANYELLVEKWRIQRLFYSGGPTKPMEML